MHVLCADHSQSTADQVFISAGGQLNINFLDDFGMKPQKGLAGADFEAESSRWVFGWDQRSAKRQPYAKERVCQSGSEARGHKRSAVAGTRRGARRLSGFAMLMWSGIAY